MARHCPALPIQPSDANARMPSMEFERLPRKKKKRGPRERLLANRFSSKQRQIGAYVAAITDDAAGPDPEGTDWPAQECPSA